MRKRFVVIISLFLICLVSTGASAAGPAKGILYTQPLESVFFSHQDHVRKGTTCATCHSGLFEMEALNAQKNKDFTMDSLYRGKYCGACHNGKKAFASDTQCARCHLGTNAPVVQKEMPEYKMSVTLGRGDKIVAFNHEPHLKKASCRTCHNALFQPGEGTAKIGMADHSGGKYCFRCHDEQEKNGFSVNDCNRCHKKSPSAPAETIKYGKGAKAVSFKHETHQLKSGCKTCHPKFFAYRKSGIRMDFNDHVNGKACFACHAKKNGTAFYACNRCHKDKPAPKTTAYYPEGAMKYKTPMQNVYFHHESHAVFACNTCHPKPFAVKKGQTKMVMSEMLHGQTCGMCHNGTKAFSASDCNRCHKK